MNKILKSYIFNFLFLLCIFFQILIYLQNKISLESNFDTRNISIENFSSIILAKSGITKIGSQKLNKVSDQILFLQGSSYLENDSYKIFGYDITINLDTEISNSDKPVEVINSIGKMKAEGFKNNDLESKIFFYGSAIFEFDK